VEILLCAQISLVGKLSAALRQSAGIGGLLRRRAAFHGRSRLMSVVCHAWYKSSYSGSSSTCVEVLFVDGVDGTEAHVRNSRQPDGPALAFSRAEWEAFELGVFSGEFHMPI